MLVQDGSQHERFVQQGVNALFVGLDADYTVLRERTRTCHNASAPEPRCNDRYKLTISQQADALQNVLNNNRLEHVQLFQ